MANILTISVEASYIRIAEVSKKSGIVVNKIARIATPEGAFEDGLIVDSQAIANIISEKLAAKNITTKDVIFSVFSTKIAIKEINTPVLNEKKLADLIAANATEYYPVAVDDYILAHSVLETVQNEGEKQMRVLLMAAPKEIITPYYKIAAANGYNIVSIDYHGNSSLQILQRHVDKGVNLTIQLMEDSTIVNIIKNNVLQLHRVIPYGRDVLTETLMDMRGITEEEATELLCKEQYVHPSFDGDMITNSLRYLVNNISRVMDYYASKNPDTPIEKAYYIGDNILGLDELFASEFNFSVNVVKKMKTVKTSSMNLEPASLVNYIGCIGSVIAPANFVTKEEQKKEASASSFKIIRLGLFGAVAAGAVLVAIPMINRFSLNTEKEDLEKNIAAIADVENLVNDYYNAADISKDVIGFATSTRGNNDVLLQFIETLEKKQPSDVTIKTLTASDGSVTISATTSHKATIAKFITQLKSVENVSSISVSTLSESKDEYGVVSSSFSLTCYFSNTISIDEFAGIKETTEDAEDKDNAESDAVTEE